MASKLNIKPLFDYVLLKPLEAEKVSAGGIYLPENVKALCLLRSDKRFFTKNGVAMKQKLEMKSGNW
jgi:co-chaperonin GroES (HSP10)